MWDFFHLENCIFPSLFPVSGCEPFKTKVDGQIDVKVKLARKNLLYYWFSHF